MEFSNAAAVDVATVELKFRNGSVVIGPSVVIVFPSVDMSRDGDEDVYSVELMRFPFVVDIEFNTDSVDSEKVLGTCV